MNSPGAYVYILHGEEAFLRDEALRSLVERMRALPAGEHNLTQLSGPEADLAHLRAAADALPFLADRRMVVVHGLLGRLQGRGAPAGGRRRPKAARAEGASTVPDEYAALLAYLPTVPPTTSLVFVEGARIDVEPVKAAIPAGRALVTGYPRTADVSGWIRRRAGTLGIDLDESAVRELATAGRDDLRRLDGELRKLGAYANGRTITRADVVELVVGRDILTWDLLDALAERRRDRAVAALRKLYAQGESPEALLGRDVAPLYRRLLLAREVSLLDRRARGEVDLARLGLNPKTLPRLSEQAARFAVEELERALDLLLELDRAVKSGETRSEEALELAVITLCSRLAAANAA